MYWDLNQDRFVQPANFTVPSSFLQKNLRDILSENHERAFAYFNVTWATFFGHNLTKFDDAQIIIGEPESFNVRNIHIYSSKIIDQGSNTLIERYSQTIEILSGREQLSGTNAGDYSIRLIGQNYADAIASIFSITGMPRARLIKGFPVKQPGFTIDNQGQITYTSDGNLVRALVPTLDIQSIRTEVGQTEKGTYIARSFIILNIAMPIIKTVQAS